MRPDVTATLAVIAGIGLGLGVVTVTGSVGERSAPNAADVPAAAAPAPAPAEPAPRTAPAVTLLPADAAPQGDGAQPGDAPTGAGQGIVETGRSRVRPSTPTGIEIPRLGVDTTVSAIDAVGASLVPPADYTTVGWWADGPQPGSRRGTAIITGHTVHSGGGAFDDLETIRAGDRVVIERPRRDLAYVVESVQRYEKGELATEAQDLFAADTEGRLALVTCEDWNGSVYLSNVVVIATDPRPVRADS